MLSEVGLAKAWYVDVEYTATQSGPSAKFYRGNAPKMEKPLRFPSAHVPLQTMIPTRQQLKTPIMKLNMKRKKNASRTARKPSKANCSLSAVFFR
jgi:hypothetical protein